MIEELVRAMPEGKSFAEIAVDKLDQSLGGNNSSVHGDYSIRWRVKSEDAIRSKLKASRDGEPMHSVINDFIGIRVLIGHLGLLEDAEREIGKWANQLELVQLNRENKFENPDESGYRAIHFDYNFSYPEKWGLPSIAKIEVQLTTKLQQVHGEISHRLYHRVDAPTDEVRLFLNDLSLKLHKIDMEVMDFFMHIEK